MPHLNGWEWVITLIVNGIISAMLVLVVIMAIRQKLNKHERTDQPGPDASPAPWRPPIWDQLAEVDRLFAQGRISQARHAALRARILDNERSGF